MSQPEPGLPPRCRTSRGRAGPPAPRYRDRSRWSDDPGLVTSKRRTPAPRWQLIAASATCTLAGITTGFLLARTLTPPPPARAAPAGASSPALQTRLPAASAPGSTAPVYRLLPLTARQLTTAATLAARFTAAYCTYSAARPPGAWLARLRPYTTATLQTALAQASTDPVLLQLRARQRTTATCTPTATAIRDIASTAVTVLVTTRQATRTRNRISTTTAGYAVTVAPGSGSWKVYDLEPATAGQAGGTLP